MEGKLKAERILILTLSFGSGHVRAAEAVGAEFARRKPDSNIRIVDALENCRFFFRAFYVWPYWMAIRFVPSLWGTFFKSRVTRKAQQTVPVWAWRHGCFRVFELITSFRPDLIICCEVGACELAVIAARENLTSARIVNVITDFEAEPVWVKPEVGAYAVPHESVARQLEGWGVPAESIRICGIPIDSGFAAQHNKRETLREFGLNNLPIILVMGGGMGPTRIDDVVSNLLESDKEFQIIALPGRDRKMAEKVTNLRKRNGKKALHIVDWTDKVAALMQAADVLVTKPGGLTLAEAAASGLPLVLFDSIPGPELSNASRFIAAGAAFMSENSVDAARLALNIISGPTKRSSMAACVAKLAMPEATADVVDLAIDVVGGKKAAEAESPKAHESVGDDRPVMILAISNGYGHIRLSESLAAAIRRDRSSADTIIADVADYMTPIARFTHVTAYLWLVKYAPRLWNRIDRYQKKQTGTSPEWFYRHSCRRLFDLVRQLRPSALIATEVGCCEIAALIKRDLGLKIPLIAVNGMLDADKAWIRPEVDLYSCVTEECAESFISNGAPRQRVEVWGTSLATGFETVLGHEEEKAALCRELGLDSEKPLVLVAGGGEGLGTIEETTAKLLLTDPCPQLIVLTGRNERVKTRCEALGSGRQRHLRVLGWVDPEKMPHLMSAADLMVSKLAGMFDEAIACGLPLVSLEPPPGAERLQHALLDEWGVGRAVWSIEELTQTVSQLLHDPSQLAEMRKNARSRKPQNAARRVAKWLAATRERDFSTREASGFTKPVAGGLITDVSTFN